MAVQGLHCYMGFSLAVHRRLTVVACLVAERGLCAHRLQQLQPLGPRAQAQ